jgi:hypothetical protein
MGRRWCELRAAGLRRAVRASVERSRRELRGAAVRSFRRWPMLDRRIWPNPVARGSYGAEVRFLRPWLIRPIAWIDRKFSILRALQRS